MGPKRKRRRTKRENVPASKEKKPDASEQPSLRQSGYNSLQAFVIGGMISVVILTVQWQSIEHYEFNYDHYYARIANNPFVGEEPPFGFRLLTSLLVYILPLSIPAGFKVVNLLSLGLTGVVLVFIARAVGLRGFLPFLAPIPYLLSSGALWQMRTIWFQDALSHLLLALAVLAFLHQRDDWVSCASVFGVLNRVSSLFFLPGWYAARFGWRVNRHAIGQCLRVWGPALILFFLIRYMWFYQTTLYFIESPELVYHKPGFAQYYFADFARINPSFRALFSRMFSAGMANVFFGILLPLFIASLFKCSPLHRRLSIFVLVVWLQFIFANDVGRLETYAFPVLIPLALLHFQKLTGRVQTIWIPDLALGLVLLAFPRSFIAGVFVAAGAYTAYYLHPSKSVNR